MSNTNHRFADLFESLKAKNEGAFVPFVNVCDPTPETSLAILESLIEAGADALELGIPFSDPCADGPVIAASAHRALCNGASPAKCLDVIKEFRAKHPTVPVSIMLYINLVFAPTPDKFFQACAESGVDAVLIPDLPVSMREMDKTFDEAAAKHGVELIAIVPPATEDDQLVRIAKYAKGYTYLLSRPGITGADKEAGMPLTQSVEKLEANGAAPGILGFGVSKPEHVRHAMEHGAAGVVVGSAIVRIINEHIDDTATMLSEIKKYVSEMKAACKR